MPRSSQSRYSSSASSNKSAAIFGSQYLFGKLPRTESVASRIDGGTNGYGFSLRYQACMSRLQESEDRVHERFRLLGLRVMARAVDGREARARNAGRIRAAVRRRHHAVARAPHHE